MARIRSVKPQLRTDLTVASWPREVRYAWVLLWGYLDDHGHGHDNVSLIAADLFPLDRDVTEKRMDAWLKVMTFDEYGEQGPLCRYEVDGRRYLHAVKWRKAQRISHPGDSSIPPCPVDHSALPVPNPGEADSGGIPESFRNPSGTDPERFAKDSGGVPEPFRPSHAGEEKGEGRREKGELLADTGSSPASSATRKRATRIAEDWTPSATDKQRALDAGLSPDQARLELTKFRNFWLAKSGRDATKLDWPATWHNWCLNAVAWSRPDRAVSPVPERCSWCKQPVAHSPEFGLGDANGFDCPKSPDGLHSLSPLEATG